MYLILAMILKRLFLPLVFVFLSLFATQCGGAKTNLDLPNDIFGISPGMNKEDAVRHLKEIGKLSREEEKRQQVWSLKNDPTYGYLAVGYDKDDQVRYVTAFAKPKDGQPKRFDQIGDLAKAKKEVTGPNHRYIWEIPVQKGKPEYSVTAQGDNADNLSMLTLSKPVGVDEDEEKEREERK